MKKIMIEAFIPDDFDPANIKHILKPDHIEISLITNLSEAPSELTGSQFVVVNLSWGTLWSMGTEFYVLPGEEAHTYDCPKRAVQDGLYGAWEEDKNHKPGESLGVFALAPIDHVSLMKWFNEERERSKDD
jgi:hypothetical protein